MFNEILKVSCIPQTDRPVSRAKEYGFDSLTDNELLSIILGGSKLRDFTPDYGSLTHLSEQELIQNGLTACEAHKLLAVFEYSKRFNKSTAAVSVLRTPEAIAQYCSEMVHLDVEHFRVLYLTSSNRLIADETLTIGTYDASLVSVRQVLSHTLRNYSSRIVLVHNHPGGSPATPSDDDHTVTVSIRDGLEVIGCKLMDHVIIAESGYYSFREHNLI